MKLTKEDYTTYLDKSILACETIHELIDLNGSNTELLQQVLILLDKAEKTVTDQYLNE